MLIERRTKIKLTCPICKERMFFLNIHLRRKHNISPDEVKERFGLTEFTAPALKNSRRSKGNSFYGKHHSDESKDIMIMNRDGKHYIKLVCEVCGKLIEEGRRAGKCLEHTNHHSNKGQLVGDKNPARQPETRRKLCKNHAAYGPSASIRAARISKSKKGRPRYDIRGQNNPAKRPEVRRKISQNNPMKDPEIVRKQIASAGKKPNYREIYLFNIINSLLPDVYLLNVCGDYLIVEGKVPDYVCLLRKKIIELFGERWHDVTDSKKRVNFLRSQGWDCLIVWTRELKNLKKLTKRILKFHAKKRFNDCNRNIFGCIEMMGQSDLYSDVEKSAEMSDSLLYEKQE